MLALWFPDLPADRLRRRDRGAHGETHLPPSPGLSGAQDEARADKTDARAADRPLVFVAKAGGALRIAAADRAARALGLHPGMALADARARHPGIRTADHDPAADRACLDAVADWCDRYTPLVALDGADGLTLDITGCAHLFGGETALVRQAVRALLRQGFAVRAAIAGTGPAAHALARFGGAGPVPIVPPGGEAEAVRPLPVAALRAAAETQAALHRMGLHAIGELADRPRAPLAARFGADLVERLDALLGRARPPIAPRRPAPLMTAERRFAEPLTDIEALLATLAMLAGDLKDMLEGRGQGARALEAAFFRADGQVRRCTVETARALRDPDVMARLFRERLEALADPLDPGFGFDTIRLSVLRAAPFGTRQETLAGRAETPDDLAALVERLAARVGRTHVLRFARRDTHVPEREALAMSALDAGPPPAWPRRREAGAPPLRPLCLFDPPQPVETLAAVPDGPPIRFRWRRVVHDVVRAEGPERIAPEWWHAADGDLTRDYFRVEDARGRRFWLFRAGLYGHETMRPRWFLHGLFA
mgnify:CR=1 FL=1